MDPLSRMVLLTASVAVISLCSAPASSALGEQLVGRSVAGTHAEVNQSETKEVKPLSFEAILNGEKCMISFPAFDTQGDPKAQLQFCSGRLLRERVSGWTYFVNKGSWPQSFVVTITESTADGFLTRSFEFRNSSAYTSFLKSFGKWLSFMNPY